MVSSSLEFVNPHQDAASREVPCVDETFGRDLEQVRHDVLAGNTGQAVLRSLNELRTHELKVLSRWAWELLQNACDASSGGSGVNVEVEVRQRELTFSHNGRPFAVKEVAHLVYHGSTKQHDESTIGQYGTGFLTTHLLSSTVRVSGVLESGGCFEFDLSREGMSAEELTAAMDASWARFKESVKPKGSLGGKYNTCYRYSLQSQSVSNVVEAGLDSLRQCAPYVLAFNHNIREISIVQNGNQWLFTQDANRSDPLRRSIARRSPEGEDRLTVALSRSGDAVVACLLTVTVPQGISDLLHVPKLFLAFPLVGTSQFGFPAVINSLAFAPEEGRDGIPLGVGQATDPKNEGNKQVVEAARVALVGLIKTAIEQKWIGIGRLLHLASVESKDWIDQRWLVEQQRLLIGVVRALPVVRTSSGPVFPADAWIPAGEDANGVYELTRSIAGSGERLPVPSESALLGECLASWANVMPCDLESLAGAWTLRKLVKWTAEARALQELQSRLVGGVRAVDWLNRLFQLVAARGLASLFNEYPVLPSEDGDFNVPKDLKRDGGIPLVLKQSCAAFGVPLTGGLLHQEIAFDGAVELFRAETEQSAVQRALANMQPRGDVTPIYAEANASLLRWLVDSGRYEELKTFHFLTEDGQARTLSRDTDSEGLVVPPSAWPHPLERYAGLFPRSCVLSDAYSQALGREQWVSAAASVPISLSPLYGSLAVCKQFLPDEALDEERNHGSKEPVRRWRLAGLSKAEVGVMSAVRRSAAKGALLLELLVDIVESDSTQLDVTAVPCECGASHLCVAADWLTPVRANHWISIGAGRQALPTADSLATLLASQRESQQILHRVGFVRLLDAVGVSPADVALRLLTRSEVERASLVQAFAGLVEASRGSIQMLSDLANEVRQHPELANELAERRATRARVAANKDLGERVELALKKLLEEKGLRVVRTGVGSDYLVESDFLADGQEWLLRIESPSNRSMLLEIKATRTDHARLTRRQAAEAVRERGHFALCVVEVPSDAASVDSVANARFVLDIGDRLAPLERELEVVESAQAAASTRGAGVELEVSGSEVRFKVVKATWTTGVALEEFVDRVVMRVS